MGRQMSVLYGILSGKTNIADLDMSEVSELIALGFKMRVYLGRLTLVPPKCLNNLINDVLLLDDGQELLAELDPAYESGLLMWLDESGYEVEKSDEYGHLTIRKPRKDQVNEEV